MDQTPPGKGFAARAAAAAAAYKRTQERKGAAAALAPAPQPPARLLKGQTPPAPLPPIPGASKYRRTAQFLLLVGDQQAADILSKLDSEQAEAVAKEIIALKGISPQEEAAVLGEFRSLLAKTAGGGPAARGLPEGETAQGGELAARQLLYAAYGPQKGEEVFQKIAPRVAGDPFAFLKDFSGDQIAFLFRDESPAAAALVFSRLPPRLTAEALSGMDTARKLEIVRRIARMGKTPPEVLEQVAAALREKARNVGGSAKAAEVDGLGALTEILKASDLSFGDKLLAELSAEDPALSRDLKERLYTLDDVVKALDRPVEEKLKTMSDRDIALLLRGRSEAFDAKIRANLSKGRDERIREEEYVLGPVPRAEVEAVARDFLTWFRAGREAGSLFLKDDDDLLI